MHYYEEVAEMEWAKMWAQLDPVNIQRGAPALKVFDQVSYWDSEKPHNPVLQPEPRWAQLDRLPAPAWQATDSVIMTVPPAWIADPYPCDGILRRLEVDPRPELPRLSNLVYMRQDTFAVWAMQTEQDKMSTLLTLWRDQERQRLGIHFIEAWRWNAQRAGL